MLYIFKIVQPTNTVYNLLHTLQEKKKIDYLQRSICNIKCRTCNKIYVGQTGRIMKLRYHAHIQSIGNSNPQSAYATPILNHRHQFGTNQDTVNLIITTQKGTAENRIMYKIINIIIYLLINSFIPLPCAECDDSLPFSAASSIPLCHPSPPTILPSSLTSPCHLFLGLPLNLVVHKFIYNPL